MLEKNEEIISSYNQNNYRIYVSNMERKFIKLMDNKLYLVIKSDEDLVIENELERFKRIKRQNANKIINTEKDETIKENKNIDDLYDLFNREFTKINKRIASMNKNMEILDNNINKLYDKVKSIEIRLEDKIDIINTNLQTNINELDEKINNLDLLKPITKIESKVEIESEDNTPSDDSMVKQFTNLDINNIEDSENIEEQSEKSDKSLRYSSLNKNDYDSENTRKQLSVLNIDNSEESSKTDSEYEINMDEEKKPNVGNDDASTSYNPRFRKPYDYKKRPGYTIDVKKSRYQPKRYNYQNSNSYDRQKLIWNKREGIYLPKPDINPETLDLDCPISIEKEIENWVGKTNARLIENKISLSESYNYILGTIVGCAKKFLNNLRTDEDSLLKANTDLEGNAITTSTAMLRKFEIIIRREFGNLNADLQQKQQEEINARTMLINMTICSMCTEYLEQYICAFKINYYKIGKDDDNRLKQLFYDKLPYPINGLITEQYKQQPKTDTLGERISFLRTWYKSYCESKKNQYNIDKAMKSIDYCCEEYEAPSYGCKTTKKYYRKKKRFKKYKNYKYKKQGKYKNFKIEQKYPKRKYYVKRKQYKQLPRNPKTCKCYNCGKIGHISRECKEPRKTREANYIALEEIEYEIGKIPEELIIYEIIESSDTNNSSETSYND